MEQNLDYSFILNKIIRSGYYSKLTPESHKAWIEQFTDDEKELAQYLAFKLINYSEKDFTQLICYSIINIIKRIAIAENKCLNLHGKSFDEDIWYSSIQDIISKTIICPMAQAGDMASSAHHVARMLRDANIGFRQGHIKGINEIQRDNTNVTTIIFLDDIIGSGEQVHTYFSAIDRSRYMHIQNKFISVALAYAPSIASAEDISNCTIVPSELINVENDITKEEFWPNGSYDQAMRMLNRIKATYGVSVNGYDGLALNIAFSHGIPDFTSPIFYSQSSSSMNWKSLLQ